MFINTDTYEQYGRDEMAAELAQLLCRVDPAEHADGYLDGVEDALLTLIQAGAADPRPETEG